MAAAAQPPAGHQVLQLEAFVNDQSTKMIGTFYLSPSGGLSADAAELKELGIPSSADAAAGPIELSQANGYRVRYDASAQKVYFEVEASSRPPAEFDASSTSAKPAASSSDMGAVLNYNVLGVANSQSGYNRFKFTSPEFAGANAAVDARVFGTFGTFSSTGVFGSTLTEDSTALRLETAWSYSDQTNLQTYRAGDVISGGLPWTRPIRMGGLQVQRNFGLRPDLVTMPLPNYSGSAAVPSIVDVYVNGVKTYSQDVASGSYKINNVPVVSGAGDARIVVRDNTGRETETRQSFYVSPLLLRTGMSDYSLEVGFPRLQFGLASNSYSDNPVGSGSLRYGWNDWLTLETHGEVGAGLYNGGAGFAARIGQFGVLSLAGSLSAQNREFGALAYASIETQFRNVRFNASAQHTFGDYLDLAAVTARADLIDRQPIDISGAQSWLNSLTVKTPKALDIVSMGIPLTFDNASLSLSLIHLETASGRQSNLANASLTRPFMFGGSMYVSAYTDLSDRKTSGIFAGVSFPFGQSSTISAGVSSTDGRAGGYVEAVKPLAQEPGSWGWRAREAEGEAATRLASAAYRSQYARVEATVVQGKNSTQARAEVEGAIATTGSSVHFSNRIDDAFAIVSTGAPGVGVSYENRFVGSTNANGEVLVRGLRAYQQNTIEIDARGLPIDTEVVETKKVVSPADRGAVNVKFDLKKTARSALVTVKRADGSYPEPGATARIKGSEQTAVVGYDGVVFLKELQDSNEVEIESGGKTCRARFKYPAGAAAQVTIGPVTCG